LRERGWVEGSNLLIDNRFAGPDAQRQRESAAALKAVPVALIVAAGTTTIRAARDGDARRDFSHSPALRRGAKLRPGRSA